MIGVLWLKSKFLFFDHVESENWPHFAETENECSKFLICCEVCENLPEKT